MIGKKNKIKLLISDTAPLYPPLWGGPKRIWNLYSNLGEEFSITYVGTVCGFEKKYINRKIKDNFREVIQPITWIYYPFRYFELKVVKNITFDIFIYLCMCFDKDFKKELNKYEADILIASHPWSSPCFKIKKGQIFIYDAHNCEYLLMKEILRERWYKGIVSFFVKLIEKAACRKSEAIIVSSERDKESFVKLYKIPEEKIFIIPNGTCIEEVPCEDKRREKKLQLKIENKTSLLFIGAYYNPNIEAARFIVEEVAPELKDVGVIIVGSVGNYFKDNNIPPNVKLIGRVDDELLYSWLAAADLGLNPMFSGSGINMKILDYFSFGLPVVTTWIGARGIDGIDSRDFIACNKEEFVTKVKYLLVNEEARIKMRRYARKLAEEIYDWNKISRRLKDTLIDLLKFGEVIDNKRFSNCLKK